MSRAHLLALDLGTTRACALLVDPDGRVAARAHRRLPARITGPGRFEQDPQALWELSLETLREVLARAQLPAREVAGLGVASQRSSALAWRGGHGPPLASALGWADRRTAARAAELAAAGVPVGAIASATKFEWLLRHEASVAAAALNGSLRLGTPDVWLTDRLTGGTAFVTDPGQASCTALYDLARDRWNDDALALFGIPGPAVPEVVASDAVVGETPRELLGAPVPVAARAGDQQAACFAQGVHEPDQAKLSLGTSAMLDRHVGSQPVRARHGHCLALWRLRATGSAFCHEATVISAGSTVDWLVEIGLLSGPEAFDRVAAQVVDAGGVQFIPALQGLGTPFEAHQARAELRGLTRGSSAAHLVRAVLEGIAQRCADLCDALAVAPSALAVDGGLAHSNLLLQTLADLSGCAIRRSAETEAAALGAAELAGLGAGVLRDPAACLARRGGQAAGAPAQAEFLPQLGEPDRLRERERWRERVAQVLAEAKPPSPGNLSPAR